VTVRSEQLESDVFEMPATSGVRLLLVTDRGRTTAGGDATPATVPPTSAAFIPAAVSEVQTDARRNDDEVAVTAIRAVLATTTALALAAAWLKRRPRRAS
jgi:hypothetical protein